MVFDCDQETLLACIFFSPLELLLILWAPLATEALFLVSLKKPSFRTIRPRRRHHGGLAQPCGPRSLSRHSNRLISDILFSIQKTKSWFVAPKRTRKCPRIKANGSPTIVKATSLAPWFPPHLQRDIYYSLLHLEPPASGKEKEKEKEKKAPPVPETVLKAALLRRAAEDINRVMAIRSQKQALAMLLQRGSVGDDLWNRFLRAEKEMEDEVRDVVAEVCYYALFPSF